MTSWVRRFIPKCTKRTHKLREITKANGPFPMPEEAIKEFEDLKEVLKKEPCIAYPDSNKTFYIHVDASKKGLGAILTQIHDGQHRVVEYASKSLGATQQRYSNPVREAFGILWALHHFRYYVYGRSHVVYTDCEALSNLFKPGTKKQIPNHIMLQDWAARILQFNPRLIHKPGKEMVFPDALS
jgi:hypothetical protein